MSQSSQSAMSSLSFLLVENLTIFSSIKHEEVVLDKNNIYTFEDIKPRDLVSIKFKYDDKSYYAFRVDLLKAMYNPRQRIVSNIGLPGQMIYNFKTNKTHKVLRLIDDNLLLDDQSLLNKYSLDYAVLELDEMSLGSDNYEVSSGVNAFSDVKIVHDDDIPELIETLSKFDKLAFDTETIGLTQKIYTLDDKEDFVVAVTISTDANSGYYIRNTKSDNFRLLMTFLGSKHLIMHNATFDLTVLKVVYGVEPKSFDDTLVMAKLMNENLQSYSLKTLTDQILKRGKQLKLDDFDYLTYVDSNRLHYIDYVLAFYATADTANTFGLYNYTLPKLKADNKLYAYYTGIELPSIIPVAVAINENGLTVDTEALNQIKVDAEKYVTELLDKMRVIAKPYIDKINQEFLVEQQEVRKEYADQAIAHFRSIGAITTDTEESITRNLINLVQYDQLPSYGSLKKLAAFHNKLAKRPQGDVSYTLDLSNTELMEKLVYSSKHGFNLPLQTSATGRPSFNKKAISDLQKYIFEQGIEGNAQVKEFFEAFTEHTKTRKLLDAFVYPTLESIKDSKDGKLHPSYNLLGTVSSRASCSNPNF